MPELPEVETVARTLLPHINHCVFTSVDILRTSALHPLSLPLTKIIGMRITGCNRRGKLLLLELADAGGGGTEQFRLVVHLRMTGRLLHKDAKVVPGKHTRCVFGLVSPTGGRQQLFFDDIRTFGHLFLATPDILQKWKFWRNLGPEPLSIKSAEFAARLTSGRSIKACLLDQEVIAGIGNIYADEALFGAGINPAFHACDLSAKQVSELLKNIKSVLRLSIRQCGSSIKDYRDADGNAGAFQNSFMAYGRGGEKCKKCGTVMEKTRISGRATVYCPACQPLQPGK